MNSLFTQTPACGIAQAKPKRHPIGTRVKHAKYGIGKIFSYEHCDEVSCGVDFGRKGKWCIDLRELICCEQKMSTRSAMIAKNLDEKEGKPKPNSVCLTGCGVVSDANTCTAKWLPPESAPLDGTPILGDFGWPCAIYAIWDEYDEEWCIATIHSMPIKENSLTLKRWMPLPSLQTEKSPFVGATE